ncbi:MAG: diguanylate cyclase [Rhodospirillaceae bacterium]|nr:diguanylate cyclase [Rhodospirillaceae bacterium]
MTLRSVQSAFAGRSPSLGAASPGGAAGFDAGGLNVLVFEDNARDRALIKKFLEAAGVRASNVHHADTIPAALQVLRREAIDLVLADYYLQPHTGLDLMDETRHSEFDVPFVVMSALDDEAIDRKALAHGAYGFLAKGELTVERLQRAIRYALAGHRREAMLGRGAERDTLTGLIARAPFIDSLAAAVANRAGKGATVGAGLLKIGALAEINETLGLAAGDEALRLLGQRLRRAKGPLEIAARLDGNMLALMMTDFLIAPHAATRGREIAAAMAEPLVLGAVATPVDLGAGIAAQAVTGAEASADVAERLLRRARGALREAAPAEGFRLGFAHIH